MTLTDDEEEMNIIAVNYPNNVKGALEATFKFWLQKSESASWKEVINALRKVKEIRLASKIEEKYYHTCDNN